MHPLSFSEFHGWKGGDLLRDWDEYLTFGGMPQTVLERNEREKVAVLNELFGNVYIKDVVERNGMADATLLAESFAKGGGLITLSLADSYSRETFAIPGRLTDASFEGCNQAIARQEAALVADERTLPVAMGWAAPAGRGARRKPLFRPGDPPTRREALKVLESRSPLSADELAAWMRLDAREANLILLELEMEGRVVADGNKFSLSL